MTDAAPGTQKPPADGGLKAGPVVEPNLPIGHRLAEPRKRKRAFQQANVLPWVFTAVIALSTLIILGFVRSDSSEVIILASTAASLFFLVFAFGLIGGLGKRAAPFALFVTGLLYALTEWTPWFVNTRSALVLAVLVAFILFGLAGFNFLFLVEELLFDIHKALQLKGTLWNAIPTLVILGVTPLVYWILPSIGIPWPTLSIGMPVIYLLLIISWIVRWRAGPRGIKIVHEGHFLAIGIIVGAGLADVVRLLQQVEGIVPSILVYLSIIVTWVFISYTTLQRAQYFIRGTDVLPWLSILYAAAFAVLAHVHFLYGAAGGIGLAAVNDVRINYLTFGVWLGLAFFTFRGAWRFLRFVRDERGLGPRTRRTAGQFARIMEFLMQTPDPAEQESKRSPSAAKKAGAKHSASELHQPGEDER
jgi:hypothetical protein